MERAGKLDPANHRILLDLGWLTECATTTTTARRTVPGKAVRVAPRKSEALVMAATHCRNFNQYEMATRSSNAPSTNRTSLPIRLSNWRSFTNGFVNSTRLAS